MLTSGFLDGMRRKAMRRGVWFSALDKVERGIMVLTIRVVDFVRSERLGREIVRILAKLKEAFKSRFVRHMEPYGLETARRIAAQAVEFGNYLAKGAWVILRMMIARQTGEMDVPRCIQTTLPRWCF